MMADVSMETIYEQLMVVIDPLEGEQTMMNAAMALENVLSHLIVDTTPDPDGAIARAVLIGAIIRRSVARHVYPVKPGKLGMADSESAIALQQVSILFRELGDPGPDKSREENATALHALSVALGVLVARLGGRNNLEAGLRKVHHAVRESAQIELATKH